jgi:RIP metalloprotease RseP
MGPVIYSTRRGPTAYTLRLLPIGAFVRVIGMTAAEQVPEVLEGRTYRQARLRDRLSIALGGPMANLALCLALMFATFTLHGVPDPTNWTIDSISQGSPAQRAGLMPSERVTAVNDVAITTFADMADELSSRPGQTVALDVTGPDGAVRTVQVELQSRVDVYGTVGEDLSVQQGDKGPVITAAVPDGRLASAGLVENDQVTFVGDRKVTSVDEFARAVEQTSTNGDVTLTVARIGEPVVVDLGEAVRTNGPRGQLGIGQATEPERLGPLQAAGETVSTFTEVATASVGGIAKFLWPPNMVEFVSGAADAGTVTEPTPAGTNVAATDENRVLSIVGAVQLGSSMVSVSPLAILWFLAVLNLFIGLFNLVPLPPLDGGHVVTALYESVRERLANDGRRHLANPKVLNAVATVFALMLLTVGVVAIWMDIVAPVA